MLVACSFALPRILGWQVYAVASGSMEPAYPVGALIFTHGASPEDVSPGDCITYWQGEITVTHRVISVDEKRRQFITKGDANPMEDGPVSFECLVGKTALFYLPWLGYFSIWLKRAGRWWTLLLFLAAGFLLFGKWKAGKHGFI